MHECYKAEVTEVIYGTTETTGVTHVTGQATEVPTVTQQTTDVTDVDRQTTELTVVTRLRLQTKPSKPSQNARDTTDHEITNTNSTDH